MGGADPQPLPCPRLPEEALRDRRLALLKTAFLEHAAQHNLRTVIREGAGLGIDIDPDKLARYRQDR
ncbi:hypothetical protein [Streptomyces sp. NBC_00286]|uniref:hypothetical protein n=1 Tax=Streptomyces sp. NBC_00286 TaxID=2975701 RepID=UPI002E2CE998|nr:hypothetical protein [Streptomyces sp. NBC_00286]